MNGFGGLAGFGGFGGFGSPSAPKTGLLGYGTPVSSALGGPPSPQLPSMFGRSPMTRAQTEQAQGQPQAQPAAGDASSMAMEPAVGVYQPDGGGQQQYMPNNYIPGVGLTDQYGRPQSQWNSPLTANQLAMGQWYNSQPWSPQNVWKMGY